MNDLVTSWMTLWLYEWPCDILNDPVTLHNLCLVLAVLQEAKIPFLIDSVSTYYSSNPKFNKKSNSRSK